MPVKPGTTLSHYEILESIGAGGMDEVYRAKGSKLGRDVAIKVLPEEFSCEEERLRRFQPEANILASLNHANIATLHGLEEHDDQHFLIMELVAGETLAERIARGPIPVDEAIPLFIQIAEGLEAAHEKTTYAGVAANSRDAPRARRRLQQVARGEVGSRDEEGRSERRLLSQSSLWWISARVVRTQTR